MMMLIMIVIITITMIMIMIMIIIIIICYRDQDDYNTLAYSTKRALEGIEKPIVSILSLFFILSPVPLFIFVFFKCL